MAIKKYEFIMDNFAPPMNFLWAIPGRSVRRCYNQNFAKYVLSEHLRIECYNERVLINQISSKSVGTKNVVLK